MLLHSRAHVDTFRGAMARYTRQELKQDKFAETAGEAIHWTVAHRSLITSGLIAVVVVAALVGGFFWYREHRNSVASHELGKALVTYNAPIGMPIADKQVVNFKTAAERSMAAKKEFYRISNEFGSTRAGQLAHYFAALCEADLGNYKVAEDQLKDVDKSRDPEVSSLSKLALASVYRLQGQEAEAMALYKELIDHPTLSVPKSSAQLGLASLYEAKQPAEAKKLYQEIAKDDPKSPAAQIATQHEQTIKQ
jgi:predicted negative regulator of RcsB-dependent stress response